MVVATSIFCPGCSYAVEPESLDGPSSVRISGEVRERYSSRKIGGRGLLVTDGHGEPWRSAATYFVYDSSRFLSYEETRRDIHRMLTGMPRLSELGLSPDNWINFKPDTAAAAMRNWTQADDDQGREGRHCHFSVEMVLEVTLAYSEPKSLMQACRDGAFLQITDRDPAERCGISLEDLKSGGMSPPVDLPCSHVFHSGCITLWLFKGTACPICRRDPRGLVAPHKLETSLRPYR